MPTSLSDGTAFEKLTSDDCWQLLATHTFGRVCFSVDDEVQVVLTAYTIRDRRLYFRATAYGALARQVASRPVTLQVDDMRADRQAQWSVTVVGTTERIQDAATLAALWSPVRLSPWEPGLEPLWISLDADEITGQRVRAQA